MSSSMVACAQYCEEAMDALTDTIARNVDLLENERACTVCTSFTMTVQKQ